MKKFIQAWHEDKVNPLDDVLVRWLLLLGMVDAKKQRVYDEIYEELEELATKDENLVEAFNEWENLSQTPETIIAYQSRLKAILDEEARLDDVREKGIEEGVKKVAKELISLNLNLETIKKATGLSIEEIETLRSEI